MSVLLNKDSRVVTQGMGGTGKFHLQGCRDYGTQMVAGVRPGKGGSDFEGCPVFDTVGQAVEGKLRSVRGVLCQGREGPAGRNGGGNRPAGMSDHVPPIGNDSLTALLSEIRAGRTR